MMTPGPKKTVSKLNMVKESDKRVMTPIPGQVQFGVFKARPVPRSLYERPSKKLQAQKLKSANKSIIGEESEEDHVAGWSARSQRSD